MREALLWQTPKPGDAPGDVSSAPAGENGGRAGGPGERARAPGWCGRGELSLFFVAGAVTSLEGTYIALSARAI